MSSYILMKLSQSYFYFFFFNDTATTEIYTLSLHDALPISLDLRLLHRIGRLLPAPLEQGQDLLASRGDLLAQGLRRLLHLGFQHPLPDPLVLLGVEAQLQGRPQIGGGDVGDLGDIGVITHRRQGIDEGSAFLEAPEGHLADLLLALAN